MNRKIIFTAGLVIFWTFALFAQNDSSLTDTNFYQSVYNLRPVLLKKNKMLLNTRLEFPRFYKMYNYKKQVVEKVPDKIVLNEFYFNTYFTYGIADKWNIYTMIPVADIHHYSPMGIQKGVGFGDIQLGVTYQLLNKIKKESTDYLSVEFRTTFPSGKSKMSPTEYPTGHGSFGFLLGLNGLHKFQKFDLWYTGYYEYRTNHSGIKAGDETGVFGTIQKPFNTKIGSFGVEGGLNAFYNFKSTKGGNEIPNSKNYSFDLYAGGWYKYLNKIYLRFGVPYSIYQNGAWMTKYRVMIQFDFLLN